MNTPLSDPTVPVPMAAIVAGSAPPPMVMLPPLVTIEPVVRYTDPAPASLV